MISKIQTVFAGILIFGLFLSSPGIAMQPADSTKVLVVATIHGNHESNKNYTYTDILKILSTFQPDAICVEIPESYFRKSSYLKEMMLATIYGTEHSAKVYPIDWWPPVDNRAARDKYVKTEEYKLKEKQYYELEKSNEIMQDFYKKYGSLDSVWNENKQGYQFFNGEEYNDYIREMYAINMAVFGDGPMNLSYQTRNSKMLELINIAVAENNNKRIIILTGAEHKHYFDIELAKRTDLKLLKLKDILPLREEKPSKNITDFIEKNLARNYYDVTDKQAIDMMYDGALISLLHGEGMDDDPDIIPKENVRKAIPILHQWEAENPKSAYLEFNYAWVEFLQGNYKKSIVKLKAIENRLDEIPEGSQWFVKAFYFRNLGFCYDMLGMRGEAVQSYKAGVEMCKKLGTKDWYIKSVYKNYIEIPYEGKKLK
ncbi:MAG: DUF5694 domain-containing protein [Bacteroidota bacterium]